jgi:hypothetical protein
VAAGIIVGFCVQPNRSASRISNMSGREARWVSILGLRLKSFARDLGIFCEAGLAAKHVYFDFLRN